MSVWRGRRTRRRRRRKGSRLLRGRSDEARGRGRRSRSGGRLEGLGLGRTGLSHDGSGLPAAGRSTTVVPVDRPSLRSHRPYPTWSHTPQRRSPDTTPVSRLFVYSPRISATGVVRVRWDPV